MKLSEEEKKMLDGEHGPGCQKAMEILVALGEIYNSEKMIPITSVHISGTSYKGCGAAGAKFVKQLADTGNKFSVFTSLNPSSVDPDHWERLGFSHEDFTNQNTLTEAYRKMGGVCLCTCTPFLSGNSPRFGEDIAWAESSALIFANSVIGARTNREGGIGALASALTGKTPIYGYHIRENRRATILVDTTARCETTSDYSAMGYDLGCRIGDAVPYLTRFEERPRLQHLKAFSAGISTSGSTALFHIEGVTPESTDSWLISDRNFKDKVEVSQRDLKAVYHRLSGADGEDIDFVGIGCPHLDLMEIRDVAIALDRRKRKVYPGLRFWVCTSRFLKEIADQMGFLKPIIEAGGEIVSNLCLVSTHLDRLGVKNLATDSAKAAHYVRSLGNVNSFFGSLENCIDAAITGKWRGKV
jgi:predicted aconitase